MTQAAGRTPEAGNGRTRLRIEVQGFVQGVGFRPFAYRLAQRFGLSGFVRNTPQGVEIEVEGPAGSVARFREALAASPPPAARILGLRAEPIRTRTSHGFTILPSSAGPAAAALASPDIAMCADCRRELLDPGDRRHRHPFVNCTNCGPRFTIIESLPYDRPATTMREFAMCAACRREYADPADRRFHAQPNACPACGPSLLLLDGRGRRLARREEALDQAVHALASGRIVAVKGIGGFHLAVDASDATAVRRLRERKGRPAKPFALMVRDLGVARRVCRLSPREEEALCSWRAPIVLLERLAPADRASGPVASEVVAPGLDRLGIMLPYTPLHHLLLANGPEALVMTSGNRSGEPIVTGNGEAVQRLAPLADLILVHDRRIVIPCDDSVEILLNDRVVPVRRGRGWAPAPLRMTGAAGSGPPVLGVGGDMKNAGCILRSDLAHVGPHAGDISTPAGLAAFEQAIAHLERILAVRPQIIACDLHPDYLTGQWAAARNRPLVRVQHHHAHFAACLADNRFNGPAVGLILDGTGYGPDDTIWGGEILAGDARHSVRRGHLRPLRLAGGERAIHEPWRTGIGFLLQVAGPELLPAHLQGYPWQVLAQALEAEINAPTTTSCGRLFDAAAAITGLCLCATFDGEAPMRLASAAALPADRLYPVQVEEKEGILVLDTGPLLAGMAEDVRAGVAAGRISGRFHASLARLLAEGAARTAAGEGLDTVALSGGCWANPHLARLVRQHLTGLGLRVLCHRLLPPGDGGLAVGQAVTARLRADAG